MLGARVAEMPPVTPRVIDIIDAYHHITRGRDYIEFSPKPLSVKDISAFLVVFEPPCDMELFTSCVFMLDNFDLDQFATEQKKNGSRKKHATH